MLYHHDENGSKKPGSQGSKEELLKHVLGGGKVRVAFGDAKRTTVVVPIAVFTREDEVYAQCCWITADFQAPDLDLLRFQNRISNYQLNVSTTGRTTRRIIEAEPTAGSNLILDDVESRLEVRWYAD